MAMEKMRTSYVIILAGTPNSQIFRKDFCINAALVVDLALRSRRPEVQSFTRPIFVSANELITPGFLALETILDLFATLIPPLRSGRVKRTQFIQKVFDTSLFICSREIIHSLESISSSDWSKTASNIMELLAGSDIS